MSPRAPTDQEVEFERRLGQLAASLRERLGVSQATLAEELGRDQSFVSKIEHAQRRMTVGDLARHMAAHDVNHILQIERILADDTRG